MKRFTIFPVSRKHLSIHVADLATKRTSTRIVPADDLLDWLRLTLGSDDLIQVTVETNHPQEPRRFTEEPICESAESLNVISGEER